MKEIMREDVEVSISEINTSIDHKCKSTGVNILKKYYYRYHNYGTSVACYQYPVIKETLKGVWLDVYGVKKFVLTDARKRWACPTQEEALFGFIKRKEKQALILRGQLEAVEAILKKVRR